MAEPVSPPQPDYKYATNLYSRIKELTGGDPGLGFNDFYKNLRDESYGKTVFSEYGSGLNGVTEQSFMKGLYGIEVPASTQETAPAKVPGKQVGSDVLLPGGEMASPGTEGPSVEDLPEQFTLYRQGTYEPVEFSQKDVADGVERLSMSMFKKPPSELDGQQYTRLLEVGSKLTFDRFLVPGTVDEVMAKEGANPATGTTLHMFGSFARGEQGVARDFIRGVGAMVASPVPLKNYDAFIEKLGISQEERDRFSQLFSQSDEFRAMYEPVSATQQIKSAAGIPAVASSISGAPAFFSAMNSFVENNWNNPGVFRSYEEYKRAHDATSALVMKSSDDFVKAQKADNPMWQLADFLEGYSSWAHPVNPAFKSSFILSDVPQTLGGAAAFVTGAVAAGPLGSGVATGTTAALGSLSTAGSMFNETLAATGDIGKAYQSLTDGTAIGVTEGLPIFTFLNRLDRIAGGKIRGAVISRMLAGGAEEGAQEFTNSVLQDLSDREVYDASREIFTVKNLKEGAMGVGFGMFFNAAGSRLSNTTSAEGKFWLLKSQKEALDNMITLGEQELSTIATQMQSGQATQSAYDKAKSNLESLRKQAADVDTQYNDVLKGQEEANRKGYQLQLDEAIKEGETTLKEVMSVEDRARTSGIPLLEAGIDEAVRKTEAIKESSPEAYADQMSTIQPYLDERQQARTRAFNAQRRVNDLVAEGIVPTEQVKPPVLEEITAESNVVGKPEVPAAIKAAEESAKVEEKTIKESPAPVTVSDAQTEAATQQESIPTAPPKPVTVRHNGTGFTVTPKAGGGFEITNKSTKRKLKEGSRLFKEVEKKYGKKAAKESPAPVQDQVVATPADMPPQAVQEQPVPEKQPAGDEKALSMISLARQGAEVAPDGKPLAEAFNEYVGEMEKQPGQKERAAKLRGSFEKAQAMRKAETATVMEQRQAYSPGNAREVQKAIGRISKSMPNISVVADRNKVDVARQQSNTPSDRPGFVHDGVIYIDPDIATPSTVLEEFGHVWETLARDRNSAFHSTGMKLMKGSEYEAAVAQLYPNLQGDALTREALGQLIRDSGMSAIMRSPFNQWLRGLWDRVRSYIGLKPRLDPSTMTLEQWGDIAGRELTSGIKLTDANSVQVGNLAAHGSQIRINNSLLSSKKSAADKTASWLAHYFGRKGNKPAVLNSLNIMREGSIEAAARNANGRFVHAGKVIKAQASTLPKEQRAAEEQRLRGIVNEYMEGTPTEKAAALAALPQDVAEAAVAMREDLSRLSSKMIALGMIKGDMVATFSENMDIYLNQFFRKHVDPDWYAEVPDTVLNRGREFVRGQLLQAGIDPTTDMVDGILKEIITGPETANVFKKGGKIGSIDASILKERKEIPEVIKELMGVEKDPLKRYLSSMIKMSNMVHNYQFQVALKEAGTGRFLFDKPTAEFSEKISSAKSSKLQGMSVLSEMYTSPDIIAEMQRAADPNMYRPVVTELMALSSMFKVGNTILSVGGVNKNFLGNAPIYMANGMFNPTSPFKGMKDVIAEMRKPSSQLSAKMQEYTEAGIVSGSASLADIKAQIAHIETGINRYGTGKLARALGRGKRTPANRIAGTATGVPRKALDKAGKVYGAADAVWKIAAYEVEKKRYAEAFPDMPEAELRKKVGDLVIRTWPSGQNVSRALDVLRASPFPGTFTMFPAEILRLSVAIPKVAFEEIREGSKTGNTNLRNIGIRRMGGFMLANAIPIAVQQISMALFGISAEEDELSRQFAPDYSKYSPKMYTSALNDGEDNHFDMASVYPWVYPQKPLMALWYGEGISGKLADMATEGTDPFLSMNATTKYLGEIFFGDKLNKAYSTSEKMVEAAEIMMEKMKPGTVKSISNISRAIQGKVNKYTGQKYDPVMETMNAFTGVRGMNTNYVTQAFFSAKQFNKAYSDARDIYNQLRRDPNATDEDLAAAKEKANAVIQDDFDRFVKKYQAALRLGADKSELDDAISSSIPDYLFKQVVSGQFDGIKFKEAEK